MSSSWIQIIYKIQNYTYCRAVNSLAPVCIQLLEQAFLFTVSHLVLIDIPLLFDSISTLFFLLLQLRYSYLASDTVNWLRGKTRGRADIKRAVLPCGGRKRAFEWWDRLMSFQRAVWKWCYFSRLNFNYIWARHWRLNKGLGLLWANSWRHSSCSCVHWETKTILIEVCRKMSSLKWVRSRVITDKKHVWH